MVQNQVNAFFLGELFDNVAEIWRLKVITCQIRAQFTHSVYFGGMGSDDQFAVGGQCFAKLQSSGVDATAAAVGDQGLAILKFTYHKDIQECCNV